MKHRHRVIVWTLTLLLLLTTSAAAKDPKYKLGAANGDGTLKVGNEEFKVTSVVVKLLENGKAEINIISEITVFISGTWTRRDQVQTEIDLQFTGEAATSGFEGSGKLYLKDKKSIARLTLNGASRATKRRIDLNFAAN